MRVPSNHAKALQSSLGRRGSLVPLPRSVCVPPCAVMPAPRGRTRRPGLHQGAHTIKDTPAMIRRAVKRSALSHSVMGCERSTDVRELPGGRPCRITCSG